MEGLYYPYSENKGADQLRGYREADLRLCFRVCKKPVFSQRGSFILGFSSNINPNKIYLAKILKVLGHKNKLRSEVIILFSCSTKLSMKFILLINVKMPTNVCISTFISRIHDRLS